MPAISLISVSGLDRNILQPGAHRHVTERVQVMVLAATYPGAKALMKAVRAAAGLVMTLVGEVSELANFAGKIISSLQPRWESRRRQEEGQLQPGHDDRSARPRHRRCRENPAQYSFLVTTPIGDKYYFQAQVTSFKVNVGSVSA